MSHLQHTYSSTCHQARVVPRPGIRDREVPTVKPQFFYYSPLPIDDPLSTTPTPTSADPKSIRHNARPFSAFDNNALEEAWLALSSKTDEGSPENVSSVNRAQPKQKISTRSPLSSTHSSYIGHIKQPTKSSSTPQDSVSVISEELSRQNIFCGCNKKSNLNSGPSRDCRCLPRSKPENPRGLDIGYPECDKDPHTSPVYSDTQLSTKGKDRELDTNGVTPVSNNTIMPDSEEVGISGTPFVKFSPKTSIPQPPLVSPKTNYCERPKSREEISDFDQGSLNGKENHNSTEIEVVSSPRCRGKKSKDVLDVPVGISRLHLVTLPTLQMKPIYWSPVNDVAIVARGTWFYSATMYPVESAVANQLEAGYRELRPWSRTWSDELNSAVEVGAAGEEKIAHRLWPNQTASEETSSLNPQHNILIDPFCALMCFNGEAAAQGSLGLNGDIEEQHGVTMISKRYPNSQVIYKDSINAFILKPTLQPSSYYGRKPLQKIRKGVTVGIHVVRGFDWRAWEKLYQNKLSTSTHKVEEFISRVGEAELNKSDVCAVCRVREEQPRVSDLVFVIHGIGQKLSERVESFNFTHAINDFRRSINVELNNIGLRRVLREDLGGVMVLPVNWRSNISLEDGEDDKNLAEPQFLLRDITPNTIPAVRNLISDVMLDVPFYMSHHKPKMIQAVISEANRIYRLWCKNNPEFHGRGRVHIVAHSLGSVMALDILSNQPTSIKNFDLGSKRVNTNHFDFNTCNLFFAGSPAGFFLLLERGNLLPRKGISKPGTDSGDDTHKDIVGDFGTFGCLAVENVYNIIHYNDPIAYRLNATVDPKYAASLKHAQVPSATTGFFESIGNAVRSITPGVSRPAELEVGQISKPPTLDRLPSTLEMDVHDFTHEEVVEKKMILLNDNGQVDWFLSSGGGPLEIQYISMLGAHSSYWVSQDFIRLIVIEIGRRPGKAHVLPNMKAVKRGRQT